MRFYSSVCEETYTFFSYYNYFNNFKWVFVSFDDAVFDIKLLFLFGAYLTISLSYHDRDGICVLLNVQHYSVAKLIVLYYA